jgi:hypothetical protein
MTVVRFPAGYYFLFSAAFWPYAAKKYQVFLRSVRRLLVAAYVVPSSPIFVTLMKEAPGSSETSVLTRATRRNNPEDTILHRPYMYVNIQQFLKTIFSGLKMAGA